MGIMDNYINDDDKQMNKYFKGQDFEGDGQYVEVVSVESVEANDKRYGASEIDYLAKQEILKIGEIFRYTFLQDEQEKIFDTKSAVFFIAFKNLNPKEKSKIIIKRTGEGTETKYEIKYAPLTEEELND